MKSAEFDTQIRMPFSHVCRRACNPWFSILCCLCALSVILFSLPATASADNQPENEDGPADLLDLSIEELMNLNVSLVSRRSEPLLSAPAAVHVITGEDLRRLGVTTVPDALRTVPGLQVAQVDANKWAISSRGFNSRFANKLLVQIDGRTIYTPLYSGVFWDVQELLLEDIDRIEVVRGPGAALWGANAVNGIINIVTKDTRQTQGGLVSLLAGTEETSAAMRYGGQIDHDTCYRVYAKGFDRDGYVDASGTDTHDAWDGGLVGCRVDSALSGVDTFTMQAQAYTEDYQETISTATLTSPFLQRASTSNEASGYHVLAGWTRENRNGTTTTLRSYWDHTERESSVLNFTLDTLDVDLQHGFRLGSRQAVTCGLGYRFVRDDLDGTFAVSLSPARREDNVFSAFLQDEIAVVRDRIDITLGAKFEHNDYTGFEVQPGARASWKVGEQNTFWSAVSQAVRTPSRIEHNGRISRQVLAAQASSGGLPVAVSLLGNENYDSEELLAYEAGYRFAAREVSLDLAAFYNVYDNLRTLEAGSSFVESEPGPPHLVLPFRTDNRMQGYTYGLETAVSWRPIEGWLLRGAHTWLRVFLDRDAGSTDTTSESAEDVDPNHQFSLQSRINPIRSLDLDTTLRYVDEIPVFNLSSYLELDVRIGWRCTERLEISVVGRNLLDSHHAEYVSEFVEYVPSEIERSVHANATWQF